MSTLAQRITDYLSSGGLFNPEQANHDAVRDLLIECRDAFQAPEGALALPAAASPFCVARVEVRGTRQELPITGVYDGTVYVHLESAPTASDGLLKRVTTLREKVKRDGRRFSVEVLDEVLSVLSRPAQCAAEGDALEGLEALAERIEQAGGGPLYIDYTAASAIRTVLASKAQPKGTTAWRDHVEDRLRTWKQRTMNKSGDMLALDDFMDSESLEDLIDFVCDEWAEPAVQAPAVKADDARDAARYRWLRTRDTSVETNDGMVSVSYIPELGHDGSNLDIVIDAEMTSLVPVHPMGGTNG